MRRLTTIEALHGDLVETAAEHFGDHENMSRARILRWLAQFEGDDLEVAVTILRRVTYYGAANIRGMTRQLVQIVIDDLGRRGLARMAFVSVGGAPSGSSVVARALRDVVPRPSARVASMLEVSRLQPGELDAIVFVDDFSGTGKTLTEWWENVEALVRPTKAAVFVGLLVLNYAARDKILAFADDVFAVTELDAGYNVFDGAATQFTSAQREILDRYCQRTGAAPRYQHGLGECGLLVAFKHGCPNNSLPVLWHGNAGWRPLFNRRGI